MIAMDVLSDALFAAVAGMGFGAISCPPKRAFPYIALLAAVGHAARFCLMTFLGVDLATGSLAAALLIGFGSLWLGRRCRTPMTVLCIPALLPMIPGKYAYNMVFSQIMFLHTMGLLQSGDHKGFMESMKEIVTKYPENEISEIAALIVKGMQEGRLLAADGSAFGSIWQRRKVNLGADSTATDSIPPFSTEKNAPHLFVLAYEDGKINQNLLLFEMARYNFSNFIIKNFDLSFASDNGIGMLITKEFTNFNEAHQYMRLLYSDSDMSRKLGGLRALIISESNFELLQKYYSFDDYDLFYNENFSDIPEPDIESIFMDEPILIEGIDQAEEEEDY